MVGTVTPPLPPYQPMSAEELAELSRDAGRELTEREAMEYLKRRTHARAVGRMLDADQPK